MNMSEVVRLGDDTGRIVAWFLSASTESPG